MKVTVHLSAEGRYIAIDVHGDRGLNMTVRRFPWPSGFEGRRTQTTEAMHYATSLATVLGCGAERDSAIDVGVEVARLGMTSRNHNARRLAQIESKKETTT